MKGKYLDGELVPTGTAAERRALVGKWVRYLRSCDIDTSGRGFYFPRYGLVLEAKGNWMRMDNGTYLERGDIREVQIIRDADEQDLEEYPYLSR